MALEHLKKKTPEEMKEIREKGLLARAKKKEERANNIHNLRDNWLDEGHWRNLASKYKLRMPNMYDLPSSALLTRVLKKLNMTRQQFNEHYTSYSYFVKNNPDVSAYVLCGLILEIKNEYS
jgi:hypothetical protein